MRYNLKNIAQAEQFKERVNYLISKGARVELTEKKPQRTLPQNNYLHLILTYFAVQHGYSLDETKNDFFKVTCNKDLFVSQKEYPEIGKVTILRSSADLDSKEMTLAIDRFKDYSATNGLVLPASNDYHQLDYIRNLEEQNKQYL